MVFFSTTGLLLHVALFPPGTTHDCAIGQAGPSIWSRLPATILRRGADAPGRARRRSPHESHSCAALRRGARKGVPHRLALTSLVGDRRGPTRGAAKGPGGIGLLRGAEHYYRKP